MNQEALLCKVSEQAGCTLEETRRFYKALVTVLAETLGQGEEAVCLPEWGRFLAKPHKNPGRCADSPRRPKKAHWTIQFKASKCFETTLNQSASDEETVSETA